MLNIQIAEIALDQIVYDHKSRLFPYSPRRAIDPSLVKRLKSSIGETGNWQPIAVRAETLEGIAGNHRFIALLELAKRDGLDLSEVTIPVVLITCDEGEAITIALAENEFREPLTASEQAHALANAAGKKPKLAVPLFGIDEKTAEQLLLWTDELDHDAEIAERQQALRSKLTQEWLKLINTRLADYPKLRAQFMDQLRHPTWVQARSLDDLDQSITKALLDNGVQFQPGRTWNETPTHKCLGCRMKFDEFKAGLSSGSIYPASDGSVQEACRHLRVYLHTTSQFIPDPNGPESVPLDPNSNYPADSIDEGVVRGRTVNLLDSVDSYCVDPNVSNAQSCFREREADAAQSAVETLQSQGIPAALPAMTTERERTQQFVWLNPVLNGSPCTAESCIHRQDPTPGFVVTPEKGGGCRMICVNAECGARAKAAAQDSEAMQRQAEKERREAALNGIRQQTIEQTLMLPDGQRIELTEPVVLQTIEAFLMPNWETETMTNVVIGWQMSIRSQIAIELGLANLADRRVNVVLRERMGALSDKPIPETIGQQYRTLREKIVESYGLARWITCLTVARGGRETIKNTDVLNQWPQIDLLKFIS